MLLRRKENETTTVVEDEPTSMIGKETHDLLSMALKDYKVSNDGAENKTSNPFRHSFVSTFRSFAAFFPPFFSFPLFIVPR